MDRSDQLSRFSGRAEVYAAARPTYPAALLDCLREACGLLPSHVVADVGSGTGKLSQLFLSNGNTVYGVEPNADMRRVAERLLAAFSGFHSVDGRAEATGLADRSIDMVAAGQAFHWFDAERSRQEFRRILRPAAFVALAWNVRETNSSPYGRDYEEFLRLNSVDYQEVHHGRFTEGEGLDGFFRADRGGAVFDNPRQLDFDTLKDGYLSTSYSFTPDHPRFQRAMESLRALFEKHQRDGRVSVPTVTKVFYGRI